MSRALASRILPLLLLPVLALGLSGCLFDQPLTAWSNLTSPAIDSRLLGVFEFKQNGKKPDDPAIIHRAAVLPLGPNRYVIYYRDFSKKPAKTLKFVGWLSRVDNATYLSLEDQTEGSPTFGQHSFARYQWEFPGNFLISAPNVPEAANAANPYRVRRALRAQLKAGSAFPFEATYWKKIARIWWNPRDAVPTEIPVEFEKGTERVNPGL